MDQYTVSSIMNVIGEIVPKETSIAVSDKETFIYYHPSKKIDLKIKPGEKIKEGSATFKSLTRKEKVSEYVDRDIFGVSYFAIAIPIFDEDVPKGAVTAILPAEPINLFASFLTVKTEDRWIPVPYEEVAYLEAQNRKTFVQAGEVTGSHKFNLSELEYFLPKDSFIRCHRSYIVNVYHIAEIHPDYHSTFMLLMKNGVKIPVSQTFASKFRKKLGF